MALARWAYVLAILVVAPVLYAFPPTRVAGVVVAGLSSIAAITVRIVCGPADRRVPWTVIGVAAVLMTVGDSFFAVATTGQIASATFPDRVDLFFLLSYLPLAVGVLWLAGPMSAARNTMAVVDTALLSLAGSLVIWITVLRPGLTSMRADTFSMTVAIGASVGYIAVLAAAVSAVLTSRRNLTVLIIALGVAAFLVGNLLFIRARVSGMWGAAELTGFLLLACTVAAGVAATVPPAAAEPTAPARRVLGPGSLVMIAAALLVAPTILLVEATEGVVTAATAIAVASIVEAGLVIARLSMASSATRRKVARAGVVRSTSRRLAVATDEHGIHDAVHDALVAMLPAGAHGDVRVRPTGTLGAGVEVRALPDGGGELVYPLDSGTAVETASGTRAVAPAGTAFVTAPLRELDAIYPSMTAILDQAGVALVRIDLARRLYEKDREHFFQTIVTTSEEVILISRGDHIVYVSPSASRMFGRDVRGERFETLVRPASPDQRWSGREEGREAVVERPDGGSAAVLVYRRDLTDDRTIRGVVTTLRDVTAERELREDLEYRANHDPLTGLANANRFRDEMRRTDPGVRAPHGRAAIVVDLDDFKIVNDTFGHQVGDGLLVVVSRRMLSCVRTGDLAARLGGDEFAVLLRDIDQPTAAAIAQRISDALAQPASIGSITVDTQSSIGLAFVPGDAHTDTLLRDADSALYAAKAAGKGRWRQYQPGMPAPTRQHLGVRTRLAQALGDHNLALHYQPIVETASGAAVGFEALLRLADGGSTMSAPEIIRAAETTGLITDLGDWVLRRALTDLSRLDGHGPRGGRYVSVNVAARQLRLPDFADRVHEALHATGADPRSLVIEITEGDLVDDDDRAWGLLADLRTDGVRIAIDDYGTGYASLSYLRQPALDIVKVDGSFLADPMSPRSRKLVKAVTDLTASLGLDQIAEGVRDEAARALLLDLGCELAQGFLFSEPLPVEKAAVWRYRP